MTLNQLQSLDDTEVGLILHIVNVIDPMTFPTIEFTPEQLVWFRHDMLIQKLLNGANHLKPEGFPTFVSLMDKLGTKVEFRPNPPVESPITASAEITSSK